MGILLFPGKISNDRRKEFVNNIKNSGITGYVSNFSEKKYLNENNINDLLKKQLMEVARDYFRIYCSSNDIYKITRVVKSTNISETYRFHLIRIYLLLLQLKSQNQKVKMMVVLYCFQIFEKSLFLNFIIC